MSFGVLINLRRKGIHSLINCRIGLYATVAQVFRLNISLSAFKSNGLIVQWGRFFPKTTRATLVLPIPYSKWNSYSVITADADGLNIDDDVEGYQEVTGANKRTARSIEFSIASSRREVHWLCIGY